MTEGTTRTNKILKMFLCQIQKWGLYVKLSLKEIYQKEIKFMKKR